jgi:hypothetical protein
MNPSGVKLLKWEQLWAMVDEERRVIVIDGERQVFKKRREAYEMLNYLKLAEGL